ncbi:hypothetical protein Tco_1230841, partial [Tanacetum coccineum]
MCCTTRGLEGRVFLHFLDYWCWVDVLRGGLCNEKNWVGNVYVQFREEEYVAKALKKLTGRYYVGTEEGVAVTAVGAEVHTSTVAMKNGDIEAVVIAEGMMIWTGIETEIENTTTRVGQGGTGAQALFIGGNVAIQKVDDIIVRF